MSELIGRKLGQYEITGLLGEGGMASVYRAHQTSIRRDVAIKVIESKLARNTEFLKRFEREAITIAALDHPHILKIYDFGREDDLLYLVMELKSGGSLAQKLRERAFSAEQTVQCLKQIAPAIDHAHRKGIIHRDLKPQNVLLDEADNAFLTDFGIAKMLGGESTVLTAGGMAMGTPGYMAPEQWYGQQIDGRTDLYALGVMLFEMLTGQIPFTGDTPAALMYQHLNQAPPPLRNLRPDLPASLEKVLIKSMAKQPDERYQSASVLTADFETALKGKTPTGIDVTAALKPITPLGDLSLSGPYASNPQAPAQRGGRNTLLLGGVGILALVGIVLILFSGRGGGDVTSTDIASATVPVIAANPTETLDPVQAAETLFFGGLTQTAIQWTPTPTPNFTETVGARLTEIAMASFTKTPAPSGTPIFIPTHMNTAILTATHTVTFTPTRTFTVAFTPTFTATVPSTATLIPSPSEDISSTLTKIAMDNLIATLTLGPELLLGTVNAQASLFAAMTLTSIALQTPTSTFTATPAPSHTNTPTHIFTVTLTPTFTATLTFTMSPTVSITPSVTVTPSRTASRTPTLTSPVAYISVPSANLRAGPGTNYAIIGTALQGRWFKVIGRTTAGDWFLIRQVDGNTAWISKQVVQIEPAYAQIPVTNDIPATPTATFNSSVTPTHTLTLTFTSTVTPSLAATLTATLTPTTIPSLTRTSTLPGTQPPTPLSAAGAPRLLLVTRCDPPGRITFSILNVGASMQTEGRYTIRDKQGRVVREGNFRLMSFGILTLDMPRAGGEFSFELKGTELSLIQHLVNCPIEGANTTPLVLVTPPPTKGP